MGGGRGGKGINALSSGVVVGLMLILEVISASVPDSKGLFTAMKLACLIVSCSSLKVSLKTLGFGAWVRGSVFPVGRAQAV